MFFLLSINCREGKGDVSRTRLIDRLQSYLPPQIMLPPRRMRCLLKQAVQYQAERCSCHDVAWRTDLDNVSLLTDHDCGTDSVSLMETFDIQEKRKPKITFYVFISPPPSNTYKHTLTLTVPSNNCSNFKRSL